MSKVVIKRTSEMEIDDDPSDDYWEEIDMWNRLRMTQEIGDI